MKELKSLIELVDPSFLELLSGNTRKLVGGVISGKYQIKKDAYELFAGKNQAILLSQLYAKTIQKLINFILLSPGNKPKGTVSTMLEKSYKDFAIIKLLIARGQWRIAYGIGNKLGKIAIENGLIDLVVMLGKEMMYYAGVKGEKRDFEKWDRVVEEYTQEIVLENKIQKIYIQLILKLKTRDRQLVAGEYAAFLNSLDGMKLKSLKALVMYFNIKVFVLLYDQNYKKVIEVCDEALDGLTLRKGVYRSHYLGLHLRKSVAHLALREYEATLAEIKKCENLVMKKGYNVELINIRRIICLIHWEKFIDAVEFLKKCTFRYLKEWKILIEAYLNCITAIKRMSASKLINELPNFSSDKTGFNLIVVGVQILLWLKKKKYNMVLDRIDYLKNYKNRYLRAPSTIREKLFINMLIQLSDGNFNRVAVIRKTNLQYEQLTNEKFEIPLNLEIEIIPFDQLWRQITKLLDAPTRKIVHT